MGGQPKIEHCRDKPLNSRLYQILAFDSVLDDLARRTHCPVAAERLHRLGPLSCLGEVKESLAKISEIRTFMDSGGSVPMGDFDDIRNHLHTASAEGSHLEPEAFRQIHRMLSLSHNFLHFLNQNRLVLPLLYRISKWLYTDQKLTKEIDRIIDLRSLEIRDRASPVLANLRRETRKAREQARRQLERILDSFARKGILQERLVTIRSGRWVLPVKETHRHLVKGVLHDKSASGATAFLEPLETLDLNNQIRRLETEERHEIERILRALTDLVRENSPELAQGFDALVNLDCFYAKAIASKTFHQHAPAINTGGVLKIKNGRHPLLLLRRASLSDVVPLSLSIGQDYNTLVVTGPNAGGKTVALKTVGLLALMVSCGLHIPADADSEVPFFGRIFAHVGDDQSIEKDLSTFTAHLYGIKEIIEKISPQDLVLIDEIGTGTDPQEGAALAMAVLELLTKRGVISIVTTHHGTLKAFAHETPGIANGSMSFDSQTLTPTYVFRADLPGSSYALEIARRIGLEESVITRSKSLIGTQSNRLEDLLLELEQQVEHNRQLGRDLNKERLVVDELGKRLERQNAKLAREARQSRQKAAEEASAILKQANATVEKAIRTIREERASQDAIHGARSLIETGKKSVKKELEATRFDQDPQRQDHLIGELKRGRQVCWKRGNKTGTILGSEDGDGRFLVAFDSLKVHVPKEELTYAQEKGTSTDRTSGVKIKAPENVQTEIDIRGMHVEEALDMVDKFLDDVLLAGLKEVRIIHGVGTGALRNSLIPFLNQHPLVESTFQGGPNKGNPGMTIVEITGR